MNILSKNGILQQIKINIFQQILKNHILQEAIDKAKESDFTMIDELLKVAHNPYDEHEELEHLCKATPKKAKNIKLSCSS